MWGVGDVKCWRCMMFETWAVRDVWVVGCFGCALLGMWGVGCLSGCVMLIYKMPPPGNVLKSS